MTIDRTYCALAAIILIVAAAAVMGCTTTAGTSVAAKNGTTGSPGNGNAGPGGQNGPGGGNMSAGPGNSGPQGGMGPGGSGGGPGSSSGSSSYTFNGTYTLNGGTATETGKTYTSSTRDVSGVYVTNGGVLTLINPTIKTSGDSSSNDASSFYGLNAAVLVNEGSSVTLKGGTIASTGSGANGVISTGSGSSATLTGVTITASGGGAHGVMATQGGNITLTDITIATTGGSGAPLATDRGGGVITVMRGSFESTGQGSPGIYSTGTISVKDATITAEKPGAAVIEGFNTIALENTSLTGGSSTSECVMIYQSMSGDASEGTGTFTMNGGSLTATGGALFFVTNTHGVVLLKGTKVTTSGTLIKAAASGWGTTGKNGGIVTFTADGETLAGNVTADTISSVDITLQNGSSLTGTINPAALTLDATSTWIVTGDSVVTGLSDTSGISGTTITNIMGNGHTVTYDSSLTANSALGGKTYSLNGGGTLRPV
jgi:hypothetical protein